MWFSELLILPQEEATVTNWQTYGIEYDGPINDIDTGCNAVVPVIVHIQQADEQPQDSQHRVDSLSA